MTTPDIEEELNVLARFIGRAVGVSGDLDALEALTKVKSHVNELERQLTISDGAEIGLRRERDEALKAAHDAEEVGDELRRMNSGLTRDFNAMLVSNSRAEALLRERIDKDATLDERILANYPESWEYRARQALKGESA